MTRIIAGRFGGRRLAAPRTDDTRPTTDRTREALFSRLDHLGVLTGARVLDLFAGSGGLGFEALSRGALHVTFVDPARPALAALKENVSALRVEDATQIRATTAEKALAAPAAEPFDIVFLDPPYALGEDQLAGLLSTLAGGLVSADAVVVVERSARTPEPTWPTGWERLAEKRYGDTTLWFAGPAIGADAG